MTEHIRTVPPVPQQGFPGMTEITRAGRSIACLGTGAEIEGVIRAIFEKRGPAAEEDLRP